MAYVYLNPLKQQLDHARQQRALLVAEREQIAARLALIDDQIQQWEAYILATMPLAEQMENPLLQEKSLADLCRMALDAHNDWITAHQVRAYIVQLGFQLNYNNVMAVLHNTLRRVGQTSRNQFGPIYARKGL